MMQHKVTDTFRQQKASFTRVPRGKKGEPELLGVHGEAAVTNFNISAEERKLRQFDLASQYGPCTGMTRLERWNRAATFGLNPPQDIYEMLTGPNAEQWQNNVWHGRI